VTDFSVGQLVTKRVWAEVRSHPVWALVLATEKEDPSLRQLDEETVYLEILEGGSVKLVFPALYVSETDFYNLM